MEVLATIVLADKDVEWIVNNIGELGVKIGEQFFFLYKGRSIVYVYDDSDRTMQLRWRPVYKREFGEVCHPPKYQERANERGHYNFGEHWSDVPGGRV